MIRMAVERFYSRGGCRNTVPVLFVDSVGDLACTGVPGISTKPASAWSGVQTMRILGAKHMRAVLLARFLACSSLFFLTLTFAAEPLFLEEARLVPSDPSPP